MVNKTYGAKSIARLRNEGCSNREIEDIVFIADKRRAKISKVEELLESGYNINQISEIYDAARTSMTSISTMDAFYEAFKPEKDCLADIANEVYGLTGAGTSGNGISERIYIAGFFKKMIDIRNENGTNFYESLGILEDGLSKKNEESFEGNSYEFNYDTGEVLV